MESQRSLISSTDTEKELNGSNVQERWSQSNRVSSAHFVQSHFKHKLFRGYWRGSVEVGGNSDLRNPVFHNLLCFFSLAGHADCGQAQPVRVLHS